MDNTTEPPSPGPDMHYVRCLKCRKILKCSRYDTVCLLNHIRTEHPEIEVVDSAPNSRNVLIKKYTGIEESDPNKNNIPPDIEEQLEKFKIKSEKVNLGTEEFKIVPPETEEIKICPPEPCISGKKSISDSELPYKHRYKTETPKPTVHKGIRYRTSIEKWRPGTGSIYCPTCCCNKRPLIKTRSECESNTCGGTCLLGCWPFCFLPCLFLTDNKEYLHCSNCNSFLGLYDREKNCIRPNKEFVNLAEATPEEGEQSSERRSHGSV